MKTIKEMKELVDDGIAQPLTLDAARSLKGQKIQTVYYGYNNVFRTDEFVVGDVMSELDYYRQLKEDCYPNKHGFNNRAEEWEHIMSRDRLQEKREKMMLLKDDGQPTYMYCYIYDDVFHCSDDDRIVFYIK